MPIFVAHADPPKAIRQPEWHEDPGDLHGPLLAALGDLLQLPHGALVTAPLELQIQKVGLPEDLLKTWLSSSVNGQTVGPQTSNQPAA